MLYPDDHHDIKDAAFVPTSQPAHTPAFNLIAHSDRFNQAQELRFNLHSEQLFLNRAWRGNHIVLTTRSPKPMKCE